MSELASRIRTAAAKAAPHVDTLLVIVVAVLGCASRFYHLDADSLWLDEAITFERSSKPLDKLLQDTIERLHLPVYFVLMHYWLKLGDDEFMLRAPAAVFGGLGVIAAIALGWVLAGRRGGWVLGLLVALSPALVHYSQEARMYSQFVLVATVALCGLLWLVKNRQAAALWPFGRRTPAGEGAVDHEELDRRHARRAWIAFVVGLIGAIYSHNTAVFFWAACWAAAGVVWLASPGRRGPFLRNWLLANLAVLVAWTPWLEPLMSQTKRISEAFWAKFPSQSTIVATLGDLFLFNHRELLPATAIALAALLGLWALRRNKTLAAALLLLALTPPAMILIVSLQRPMWLPRIMLWCSIPFFALACCGIAMLRSTMAALALAAVIAVSGTRGLLDGYYATLHKPRWEEALRYVQANQNGESIVLLIGEREGRLVRYYTGRRTDPIPKFKFRSTPVNKLKRNLRGYRKAWLISSSNKPNIGKVLRAMPTYGKRTEQHRYGGRLRLWVYRLKPPPPPPPPPPPAPAPALAPSAATPPAAPGTPTVLP